MLNFMLLLGGDADARDKNGRTPLDLCDDMGARKVMKDAYKKQGDLRVERWGPGGVPPLREGEKPVTILEQAIKVMHTCTIMCDVYIYIYIYIYIYRHIYMYMHIYMHIYIHTNTHTPTHPHTYADHGRRATSLRDT